MLKSEVNLIDQKLGSFSVVQANKHTILRTKALGTEELKRQRGSVMANATVARHSALESGFVLVVKSRIPNQPCACPSRPTLRPLCLGSTSPQQLSTCGIPLESSLLGLRRGFVRGSELIRRSSQGGPRADSETEERPIRAKENGRVGGLDELDNQLSSLSSSDNSIPNAKKTSQGNGETAPREERKRVDWPVFGEGFVLYISMALILLTIVNNVLFRLFLGPPVPSTPPFQETEEMRTEASLRERYKLRSFRDPKYRQNIGPPSVTDVPLS